MKRTCYLPLIVILVALEAFSQSLGGIAGATEHHVKGTFKCTRTTQGASSTTSSSKAADADMTHITSLAQHDTTKSTERPVTTKEGVKTAEADMTHVTTLTQHDTTKSTERPDFTTKERVKTADADMTLITTLAQHDTTKSTERPESTTEESVKYQSMYWISDDKVTWSEAVEACRNSYNNGHLVHIDNKEENDEVKAFLEQTNIGHEWIWIGIHDSKNKGVWTYEDGSNLTYVNWGNGEPTGEYLNEDEDCGVIKDGYYNDINCKRKYRFCCEYYVVIE